MLRRKQKAEQEDDDNESFEAGPKVSVKRRKVENASKAKQLEEAVFGTKKEVLEEVHDFESELKVKKSKGTVVERQPKWIDDNEGLVKKFLAQPDWASLEKKDLTRGDESDNDLAITTGDYLLESSDLRGEILAVERCTNANKEQPCKEELKSIQFHSSEEMLMAAGMDCTLSFFKIDGNLNTKIGTVAFDEFPIYTARITVDGEKVIVGSRHKSFQVYDIKGNRSSRTCLKGIDYANNSEKFVLSPDGQLMCLLGQSGHLHLLSVKTRELVHTFRMNGLVQAACFNSNGDSLLSHGDDGEVFIWDVRSRRLRHKFVDEGCTKGTSIAVSCDDNYVAAGSFRGVVNLYDQSCFEKHHPKPLKAIQNLTTACTSIAFNSTSEILAIASDKKESAVKLVHVPTQTVFSNFPYSKPRNHENSNGKTQFSIFRPNTLDFSPNSGYFAVGNDKGKTLLYRLGHYTNY